MTMSLRKYPLHIQTNLISRISNEELTWNRNGLMKLVSPMCGPSEKISTVEVHTEIDKMKRDESAGPMGVVAYAQGQGCK